MGKRIGIIGGIGPESTLDYYRGISLPAGTAREAIDSLILGCTELPLILDREAFGIPFLNTTAIHVEGIVRVAMAGEALG